MLSKNQVENDSVASSIVNDNVRMVTWTGDKEKIIVYPVDYGKQYNITCTHPEYLSDRETSEDNSAAAIGETNPILSCVSVTATSEQHTIRKPHSQPS